MPEHKTPSRAAFEEWYDSLPPHKINPWDVWEAAISYAAQAGHACTFALDGAGNIYRRYQEPQCKAADGVLGRDDQSLSTRR